MGTFADHCRAQVAGQRAMAAQAAETEEIFAALLATPAGQEPVWPWPSRDPRYFKVSEGHDKYWCLSCDAVRKRRGPCCGQPMVNMGDIWKPGPKGNRMKHYPAGGGDPNPWGTVPVRYWWKTDWSAKRRVKGKIRAYFRPG